MHRVSLVGAAAIVAAAAWHVSSFAQSGPAASGSRSAPTYTAAQAALGQSAYRTSCASCHGNTLDDGAFGPPLKGVPFIQKYGGRSVESLYTVSAARI